MPVALVTYTMSVFDGVAIAFGIMTMIAMFAYTANKFHGVGKRRGYNKLTDAFCYASVGNVCGAFVYQSLMFIGFRVFNTFNAMYFSPLAATVAYMCVLGIIACITYLRKNKGISQNRRALMIFLAMFAASIMLGCVSEILTPYGINMPSSDSLSVLVMVSGFGIALSGYGVTREDKEAEYA